MAVATNEQIMAALLAVLQNNASVAAAFPTISRRFMTWEQVVQLVNAGTPLKQPALFLYDGVGLGGGIDSYDRRAEVRAHPARVFLRRTIVIYATLPGGGTPAGPDTVTPGGSVLHPLIETIFEALVPDDVNTGALTLGGLVSHCWIKGNALMMTGEIDPSRGQGMATLPVEILKYPSYS